MHRLRRKHIRFVIFFYFVQCWIQLLLLFDALMAWLTMPLRIWRRRRFRRDWGKLDYALTLSFEALQSDTSDVINDEYCWMHQPGGWTCQICREEQRG